MDFEPDKFFVGLFDFFSILLPGALLTYLLKGTAEQFLIEGKYVEPGGAEGWTIFLVASYMVGHFVFLFSAWLLDDYLYDRIRKATYLQQVQRLARGERLSPRWARTLAGVLFRKSQNVDRVLRQAEKLKAYRLGCPEACSAINTFQWCKARLAFEHPEALANVERFEADSKFFRSLIIVLCILIVWGFGIKQPRIPLVAVLSFVPALWRYTERRSKSVNQAYWYIITLEGEENCLPVDTAEDGASFSRAGGVVVRRRKKVVEYLLVQAKNNPLQWVLPKGHVEPGETIRETAVREVREETGVWAHIDTSLCDVSFELPAERQEVKVRFFLMQAETEADPLDKGREHRWLQLEDALKQASHQNVRDALLAASQRYS